MTFRDKAVEALVFMPGVSELEVEGVIFDIQRYSIHDGPGIRTNVFFKGCPLHCGWCANPESQGLSPEIAIFSKRCINCGQFNPPCPQLWEHHKAGSYSARSVQRGFSRHLTPGSGQS